MLRTVDLLKRFGGSNLVLDGVSVAFDEASVAAIMGPSGSRKTTLFHCLSGTLRITSGEMLLNDVDVMGFRRRKLDTPGRTSSGFIFQDYNLIDTLTAAQNVRPSLLFGGAGVTEPRAREMSALVGLSGLESRYPTGLSGGQRQRIAIARALVAGRGAVFANELTGALDNASRWEVLGYFAMLPTLGSIVVVVIHDPTVVAAASRVLFLCDGMIVDNRSDLGVHDITTRLTDLEARS